VLILSLSGCAGKPDPYGQQVQRAAGLAAQGEQSLSQGDFAKAGRDFSRALEVSRSVDNPPGVARQLNNLGAVALEQGDLKKARELFTQAFEINQGQQQWSDASVNQANLATAAQKGGNWQDAARHLQQAEAAAAQARTALARGRVQLRWADFHLDQKNPAAAASSLNEAQKLVKKAPPLEGAWAYQKGRLALAQGDTGQALTFFEQALNADRKALDRGAMGADLFSLGETHQLRGEMAQAWDSYSRAFDVYAPLGKKALLTRCLARLQEVNTRGRLGHSLERFQKHPRLTAAGDK
jgi:tetratricopeptide (TPR) repeat protein